MSLPNARQGCNYYFPRITFSAVDFAGSVVSLVGQEMIVEFSTPYLSEPALVLTSLQNPRDNEIFDWTPGAVTSTLDLMISSEVLDANLPPGQWTVVFKISNNLAGDDLIIQHNVKDMTLALTVEKWPAVIDGP